MLSNIKTSSVLHVKHVLVLCGKIGYYCVTCGVSKITDPSQYPESFPFVSSVLRDCFMCSCLFT